MGTNNAPDFSPGSRRTALLILAKMLLLVAASGSRVNAQSDPQRPPILGVAHAAVFAGDLNKARTFYKDFLGFAEPFSLQRPDGTDWLVCIKVNDQQYIELMAGTAQNAGHLSHFAIYTADVGRMRLYLASRGVEMVDQIHKGQSGDRFFTIKDPDGHFIEIVEYQPDSLTARDKGRLMPAQRISTRLTHVGILVGDAFRSVDFYRNVLGFQELSRNSKDEKDLRWIDMRVPEGPDYVELILDPGAPSPEQHKAQNHISLVSGSAQKSAADLRSRAPNSSYGRPIQVENGNNQSLQVNLFDPDGARIEIMELAGGK